MILLPSWWVPLVLPATVLLVDVALSKRPLRCIRECRHDVCFPEHWWWVLRVVKMLAAVGLSAGVGILGVAFAANCGVSAYFLCAAAAHNRARATGSAFLGQLSPSPPTVKRWGSGGDGVGGVSGEETGITGGVEGGIFQGGDVGVDARGRSGGDDDRRWARKTVDSRSGQLLLECQHHTGRSRYGGLWARRDHASHPTEQRPIDDRTAQDGGVDARPAGADLAAYTAVPRSHGAVREQPEAHQNHSERRPPPAEAHRRNDRVRGGQTGGSTRWG